MRRFATCVAVVGASLAVPIVAADAASLFAPVVVGVPAEDVGAAKDAGVVHIVGTVSGSRRLTATGVVSITEATLGGTVRSWHRFGEAVALGHLNADAVPDVAIGAPGADGGRGRVYVLLSKLDGSGYQLGAARVLRQGAGGVAGVAEPGDGFGSSLAFGQRSNGVPWLAIGAPGEDVGSTSDAGVVHLLPGATGGTSARLYVQGSSAPGASEQGDHFGAVLATTGYGLAIGVPDEDVGTKLDAGAVVELFPGSGGLPGDSGGVARWQGSAGVAGTAEAGDRFGAALAEYMFGALIAGVPGEDVGSAIDAGAVNVETTGATGFPLQLTQGMERLDGVAQSGDRFGAAVSAFGVGGFAIGVPGEDAGAVPDAGRVHVVHDYGKFTATWYGAVVDQDTPDVNGAGEWGDRFGSSLSFRDGRLVVGAPLEGVGAVAVAGSLWAFHLDDDTAAIVPIDDQMLTQSSIGGIAEPGDRFAARLAS